MRIKLRGLREEKTKIGKAPVLSSLSRSLAHKGAVKTLLKEGPVPDVAGLIRISTPHPFSHFGVTLSWPLITLFQCDFC